jgi:endonuclease/exonuclease/phosphatase family metal-dependent hydrolase
LTTGHRRAFSRWTSVHYRRFRMRRGTLVPALVVLAAVLTPPATAPVGAQEASPIRIRVMSFNIQYGAYYSTIGAVVRAIRRADADVVALQEAFGKTRLIARKLGWYASPRMHVVSRFPIVHPGGSRVAGSRGGAIPEGTWAYLLLGDGAVAAIAQTHTPWWPSGLTAMLRGEDEAEVIAREQGKVRWLTPHLQAVAGPISEGTPTIFAGDLNSPSHLDWTQEAVDELGWQPPRLDPRGERYVVRWPVTVAMEEAGFRDTFREAHPDPVSTPGFTYCVRFFPACGPFDTWDRIDYVYVAGPVDIVGSQVVGEGGPFTDIRSRPWPTDHRAVVSEIDVTPVVAPEPFAAPLDERVWLGRAARIAFQGPASPGRSIGLWPSGADPATDLPVASVPIDDAATDGIVDVVTDGLDPGDYLVGLLAAGSVSSSSWLSVVERSAPATIGTDAHRYEAGDPIGVSWTDGPGNRYDWLGVFPSDCRDPASCPLPQWRYVDARISGSAPIARGSEGVWPMRPGRYVVALCVDDDYRCIATSEPFRVSAA